MRYSFSFSNQVNTCMFYEIKNKIPKILFLSNLIESKGVSVLLISY